MQRERERESRTGRLPRGAQTAGKRTCHHGDRRHLLIFRLASGVDWGTMVDTLVALASQRVDVLRSKQSALRTQVSALGSIASSAGLLQELERQLRLDWASTLTPACMRI